MPGRTFLSVAALFALMSAACRCDPNPDAKYARDYEGCFHADLGEPCNDGPLVCHRSPFEGGNFCTQQCQVDEDCEPLRGRAVVCAHRSGQGLCVVRCDYDKDCPWETECVDGPEDLSGICQPD